MTNIITVLRSVTYILAVGSVDGICTAAAVLRNAAKDCGISFCQAFTLDKIDPTAWPAGSRVLFVDLAVNNRDAQMTADFVSRLDAAGHTLVGVLDEHNANDWRACLGEERFMALEVQPVSQDRGEIKSSGALLATLLGDTADEHTRALCHAANEGDRMNFDTPFGREVNSAVKSKIADDSRRVKLATHFAQCSEPDEQIRGWIAEYEVILANHQAILDGREDLGNGIVRVHIGGKQVDMTTLMNALYRHGRVVVAHGRSFNKSAGKLADGVSFGCAPGIELNLVTLLQGAGLDAMGFAGKATIFKSDEEADNVEIERRAIEAVRKALTAS